MKRTIFLFVSIMSILGMKVKAQTYYRDPLLMVAINMHGSALKNQQDETSSHLSNLKRLQIATRAQLETANKYHEKFKNGLTEVSAMVRNGVQVKYMYDLSSDIISLTSETIQLTAKYPHYAVFAHQAANSVTQRALRLSAEISQIISGGEINMMDSGERYRLLNHITMELRLMRASINGMKYSIQRAIRVGFFNRLNPFQRWVNRDAQIIRRILQDAASI